MNSETQKIPFRGSGPGYKLFGPESDYNIAMARRMTLVSVAAPSSAVTTQALIVVGSAVSLAILSQLSIPTVPVPITLQNFGVVLIGLCLGWKKGLAALATYFAAAASGLPVLANASSFWSPSVTGGMVVNGPTAGYLLGFAFCVVVTGVLAELGWTKKAWSAGLAAVLGMAVIYLPGLAWLYLFMGSRTLEFGLYPFVVGDLIKCAAVVIGLPAAWKLVDRKNHSTQAE